MMSINSFTWFDNIETVVFYSLVLVIGAQTIGKDFAAVRIFFMMKFIYELDYQSSMNTLQHSGYSPIPTP